LEIALDDRRTGVLRLDDANAQHRDDQAGYR
jgi:hypothetical protein